MLFRVLDVGDLKMLLNVRAWKRGDRGLTRCAVGRGKVSLYVNFRDRDPPGKRAGKKCASFGGEKESKRGGV